jgi:hypothetical protein
MLNGMLARALTLALLLPAAALLPDPSAAQPAPLAPLLERVAGSCGELTPGTQPPPLALTATVRRGAVRLRVRHYVAPCSPPPEFRVEVTPARDSATPATVTLRSVAPTGTPVAQCLCTHQLEYALRGLPSGRFTLRLEAGRSRPAEGAPSGNAPRFARVDVQIP